MSDTEYTPNPLQVAYNAALAAAGRQAANEVCKAHGVTDNGLHPWRRVPTNRAAACVKALEALAGSTPKRAAAPAPTRMEQSRRQSFANLGTVEERAPTPKPAAKRLDPDAIYSRWNNPPPVED
jgi:hypothetical protein